MTLSTHSQYIALSQKGLNLMFFDSNPWIACSSPHPKPFIPIAMWQKPYAFVIAVPNLVIQRHGLRLSI
jgi:hypothetical protein